MSDLYATPNWDRSYLALASNPSDYVQCGTAGAVGGGGNRTEVFTQEGEYRYYANFRTRTILGTANSNVNTFVLRAITQANAAKIKTWAGKTVVFRDTYGRKNFGTFLVTSMSNIARTDLCDVAVALQDVTFIEGV